MTWFSIWVVVSITLIAAIRRHGRTVRLLVGTHGLRSGDGPIRLSSTGPLPGGVRGDVDYYVTSIDNGNVFLKKRWWRL